MRLVAWLRTFLLGVVLAAGACGQPGSDRANVVLITLDTTRADRLGCYGNDRIETPHLDRLAEEGILFENAFTPVPSTLPSHCSIMTGTYPARHGVHDNGVYRLDSEMTTLAESFREAGYRTGAFVSAFVLNAQFGLDQGFDVYDDEVETPLFPGDPRRALAAEEVPEDERRWVAQQFLPFQRSAEASTLRALDWLGREPGPFFLWVHYFDPHMSYQPPAPWDTRYDGEYSGALDGSMTTFMGLAAREGWTETGDIPAADWQHMLARYDGELSFVDHWIGRLFEALEERGDWDESLIVVVADHGEAFGEHGQIWEHNAEIYDEVVRVPLLLKLPDGAKAGERITRLVRTIDVAPTLLEVTGIPGGDGIQGESLLLDPAEPRDVLLQALRGRQALPSAVSRLGVRTGQEKLTLSVDRDGRILERELFDLHRDPEERAARADVASDRLEAWTQRTLERHREPEEGRELRSWRGIDQMTSEALEALGYLDPGH